jgi:cytoskeletal protein RodZ
MGRLSIAQAEQLRAISEQLCQARQQREISLEEIAVKTYIPLRILQALEHANAEQLPEPVFVQGFIRRYGDAVGLDGAAISKSFKIDLDATKTDTPLPARASGQVGQAAVGSRSTTSQATRSTASNPASSFAASGATSQQLPWTWLLGIPATAIVLVLGYLGVIQPLLSSQQTAQPQKKAPTATGLKQASQRSTPKINPSPAKVANSTITKVSSAPAPNPSFRGVQAVVSLADASWVAVVVDGKVAFEGTLSKGAKQTWSGKQAIVLTAGNAGAVVAAFNGQKQAKPLGAPGDVRTATISSKGVQIQ